MSDDLRPQFFTVRLELQRIRRPAITESFDLNDEIGHIVSALEAVPDWAVTTVDGVLEYKA